MCNEIGSNQKARIDELGLFSQGKYEEEREKKESKIGGSRGFLNRFWGAIRGNPMASGFVAELWWRFWRLPQVAISFAEHLLMLQ